MKASRQPADRALPPGLLPFPLEPRRALLPKPSKPSFPWYPLLQNPLHRYLIEVAHVALVPGDAFGAPDCIRISYAASMETLAEALRRISAALEPGV